LWLRPNNWLSIGCYEFTAGENLLAIAWATLPVDRPVWLEAESRMVGACRIPDELFQQ
jgi:hypothetical protein